MAAPSPALSLSRTTEQAALAYIATLDPTYAAFSACGKSSVSKTGKAIIAWAEEAKYDGNCSGNAHVTLHIITKYPLAEDTDGVDPVTASDALTATVFNGFSLGGPGDFEATANALNELNPPIPDFTAITVQRISEEAHAEDGQVWVETLTLDVYACRVSGA